MKIMFELKNNQFLLDGKPFKILSGALHYFRIRPDQWEESLINLKKCGFNTVETYIPWNIHEKIEGKFTIEKSTNFVRFFELAQKVGLHVIVRPGPYICAEWDFGGLPAWLLNYPEIKVRTLETTYISKAEKFLTKVCSLLKPLLFTNDGPILMVQVENEYGSFSEDKEYLRKIKNIIIDSGIDVPLFTSDGAWDEVLEAGSLIDDGVLPTGNFGSKAQQNLRNLEVFINRHNHKFPLMTMEFWDGWFGKWGYPLIKREEEGLIEDIKENLKLGSINLYMFRGGTNFGFMNGCSSRKELLQPQITSYDYDAIIDESGNPTPKYYKLQELMLNEGYLDKIEKPIIRKKSAYKNIRCANRVSLFSLLPQFQMTRSIYPQAMELLGSGYGYALYRSHLQTVGDQKKQHISIHDANDRIHFYQNEQLVTIQTRNEAGVLIDVQFNDQDTLDLLIENQGRVNYGPDLWAHHQKKGLLGGVKKDLHFITHWEQYALDFQNIADIDFNTGTYQESAPTFFIFEFQISEIPGDSFLDCRTFGKGCVFVNGFNLGRYWNIGPSGSLYIPSDLLKKGNNKIVIFETDGKLIDKITLNNRPTYITIKESEKVPD